LAQRASHAEFAGASGPAVASNTRALAEYPEWDRAITDFARMAINEKASETEINDEFVLASSYLS
jgi:hypothetical protein